MPNKLDVYLEEISHYLSGRTEREEILNEIRSHILEKQLPSMAEPAMKPLTRLSWPSVQPAASLSNTPRAVPLLPLATNAISFAIQLSFCHSSGANHPRSYLQGKLHRFPLPVHPRLSPLGQLCICQWPFWLILAWSPLSST